MSSNHAIRAALAFFLVTFSTAFLMTVGIRLTGWFTTLPQISPKGARDLGVTIMIAVTILAVGATIRRMDAGELRSALLGAAAVLLSISLSSAAINHDWGVSSTITTVTGLLLLAGGMLVALTLRSATPPHNE